MTFAHAPRRTACALLAVFIACIGAIVLASPAAAQEPGTAEIINGSDTAAADLEVGGRWNHLVALVGDSSSNAWLGQFCGGSLVAPGWVLTAAHCVWQSPVGGGPQELASPGSIDIVAGRRNLTHTGTGVRLDVDLIISHPSYDPNGIGTDVPDLALLRLAKNAPSSVAEPIAVAGAGESAIWAPGATLRIAGWGNQTATICPSGSGCFEAGAASWPTISSEASITRVADATCGSGPAPGYSSFDATTMVCAGVLDTDGTLATTNGRDTCQGDSGGPLIADPGPTLAARRLVGVTSFGIGCGSDNYGVYARAAAFASWVTSTQAGNGGASRPATAAPGEEPFGNGAAGGGGGTGGGGGGGGGGGAPPEPGRDPQSTAAPGAPTALRIVERTVGSVTFAWDAPTSGGAVTGYLIDIGEGDAQLVDPSTLAARVSGLNPGEGVTFFVRSIGAGAQESELVTLAGSALRDTVAPSRTGAPRARPGRGASATLTWAAAQDNHKVASYRVLLQVGRRWRPLAIVPATRRSYTARSIPARGASYAIQAVDASGNLGPRSAPVRVRGR